MQSLYLTIKNGRKNQIHDFKCRNLKGIWKIFYLSIHQGYPIIFTYTPDNLIIYQTSFI